MSSLRHYLLLSVSNAAKQLSAMSGHPHHDILPPMIEDTAHWPSGTVRLAWHGQEDPDLPLTGVHGLCFCKGKVLVCDILDKFDCRHESTDRRFVTISELPKIHHEWNAVLQEALDAVVEMGGL